MDPIQRSQIGYECSQLVYRFSHLFEYKHSQVADLFTEDGLQLLWQDWAAQIKPELVLEYDAALRWGGKGYGLKAGAAAAIADPNEDDADLQYNGSVGVLHENTGLNASLSFGLLDRDGQDDAQNYFGKVGWIQHFFDVGQTALSVDYTRSLNLPTDRDDAYSIAAAAVQQFDQFGAEVFALYRKHSVDRRSGPGVQDIDVVSVGTRVKF